MDSTAKYILGLLAKRGLTQRGVADLADIDRTQLGRWFSGRSSITCRNLEKVMGVLGLVIAEKSRAPESPQSKARVDR